MRSDVLVAGAGPAGCAAAIVLARGGIRVTVSDRAPAGRPHTGEMLQPAAWQLLEYLGVDVRQQQRAAGVSSAWESEHLAHADFFSGTFGEGWLLDREAFDRALAAAALDAGATFSAEADSPLAFVVDATGRAASVARVRGAKRIFYDQLTGVFGRLENGADRNPFTSIEAVENGWWYSGGGVIAFMSDADIVRSGRMHTAAGWLEALARTTHTRARAGSMTLAGGLRVRAASSSILAPVTAGGWVAAGDAASTWDPLSASGTYKALRDGIAAANAIIHGTCDRYAAGVAAAFDEYLATRNRYYGLVTRWPESLFWQRRSEVITLDPQTQLRAARSNAATMARLDPRLRLEEVLELCRQPRIASDVVAACSDRYDDVRVILAIQAMLREGLLDRC